MVHKLDNSPGNEGQGNKGGRPPKPTLPASHPIGRRLEEARRVRGYATLRDFWRGLQMMGARQSYEAVKKYHYDREPPVAYLETVGRLTDFRVEWLATGRGARTYADEAATDPMTVDREIFHEHHERVAGAITEAFPGYTGAPAWVRAAILGTWAAIAPPGSTDEQLPSARALGESLAAPLRALGVDPSEMPTTELCNYLMMVCGAVLSVRTIRQKQLADMRARYPRKDE